MMTDEILRCGTCFRPVRIVRLTSDMPEAFGHVENPRNLHHRVTRLARTAAVASHPGGREDNRRLSEGPEAGVAQLAERRFPVRSPEVAGSNPALGLDPSTQRANATRRAPDGPSRTASSSGTPSPSGQGRRSRGIAPRPLGSGPARSAGRSHTVGEVA